MSNDKPTTTGFTEEELVELHRATLPHAELMADLAQLENDHIIEVARRECPQKFTKLELRQGVWEDADSGETIVP